MDASLSACKNLFLFCCCAAALEGLMTYGTTQGNIPYPVSHISYLCPPKLYLRPQECTPWLKTALSEASDSHSEASDSLSNRISEASHESWRPQMGSQRSRSDRLSQASKRLLGASEASEILSKFYNCCPINIKFNTITDGTTGTTDHIASPEFSSS